MSASPTLGAARWDDSIPCVGEVMTPPAGLEAAQDDALLQEALGASGKGALCAGEVLVATGPVTVYRVWDSAKDYTLYGRWWSFDRPEGPRDRYREENDICPSWSELNVMSSCQLKAGTKVVVGPGQSADCETTTLPKSPVNQIYIPNDGRNGVILLEGCSDGTPWP